MNEHIYPWEKPHTPNANLFALAAEAVELSRNVAEDIDGLQAFKRVAEDKANAKNASEPMAARALTDNNVSADTIRYLALPTLVELNQVFNDFTALQLQPVAVHGPGASVKHPGKQPKRTGWNAKEYEPAAERAALAEGENIGLRGGSPLNGGVLAFADLDFDDVPACDAALQTEGLKGRPVRTTGKVGRAAVPVVVPVGTPYAQIGWKRAGDNGVPDKVIKLEIRATRQQQTVVFGTHAETRQRLEWHDWSEPSAWQVVDPITLVEQIDAAVKPLGFERVERRVRVGRAAAKNITPGYTNSGHDLPAKAPYIEGVISVNVGETFTQAAVRVLGTLADGWKRWLVSASEQYMRAQLGNIPPDGLGDFMFRLGMAARPAVALGADSDAMTAAVYDAIAALPDSRKKEHGKHSFTNGLKANIRPQNVALVTLNKATRQSLSQANVLTTRGAPLIGVPAFDMAAGQPSFMSDMVKASGLLELPKLPEFKSCPLLADIVARGPCYGVDRALGPYTAIGLMCDLAASRFDVEHISGGNPLGLNIIGFGFNTSGGSKSTLQDCLAEGAEDILKRKAAKRQEALDAFEGAYKEYADACKKRGEAPTAVTALKPKRIMTADSTPQAIQQTAYASEPTLLVRSAEASTLIENGFGEMKHSLSNFITGIADGKVQDSARINKSKSEGKSIRGATTGRVETEARSTGRCTILGLTQDETWMRNVVNGGNFDYLEGRGAVARMLLVPAEDEVVLSDRYAGKVTRPGSRENSPFREWESVAATWAERGTMFIERTSTYARQAPEAASAASAPSPPRSDWIPGVVDWTKVLPHAGGEKPAPTGSSVAPMTKEMAEALARSAEIIEQSKAPLPPDDVMLGGDTMRRFTLRVADADKARLNAHFFDLMKLAEGGALGKFTPGLKSLLARLADKVLQVAASMHCINTPRLLDLNWFNEADRSSPLLTIGSDVFDDAYDFVERVMFRSVDKGFYGHRIKGMESEVEAKVRKLNSPTVESATAAGVAQIEGVVLRKLAKAFKEDRGPVSAGRLLKELSKKQRRDLRDADAVRAVLDRLVTAGTVAAVHGAGFECKYRPAETRASKGDADE